MENSIAFLDAGIFNNGEAYRGGCLVTDTETNPLEFRCTSAVKPTEMQKILYGSQLISYVYKELFGLPIIAKLENKPNLIVVKSSHFLSIRQRIDIPVVLVLGLDGSIQFDVMTGFDDDKTHSIQILEKFSREAVFQPFERVQIAIQFAHEQKVGDS
jgi:hypothetical protein